MDFSCVSPESSLLFSFLSRAPIDGFRRRRFGRRFVFVSGSATARPRNAIKTVFVLIQTSRLQLTLTAPGPRFRLVKNNKGGVLFLFVLVPTLSRARAMNCAAIGCKWRRCCRETSQ